MRSARNGLLRRRQRRDGECRQLALELCVTEAVAGVQRPRARAALFAAVRRRDEGRARGQCLRYRVVIATAVVTSWCKVPTISRCRAIEPERVPAVAGSRARCDCRVDVGALRGREQRAGARALGKRAQLSPRRSQKGRAVESASAALDYFDRGSVDQSSRIIPAATRLPRAANGQHGTMYQHATAIPGQGSAFSLSGFPTSRILAATWLPRESHHRDTLMHPEFTRPRSRHGFSLPWMNRAAQDHSSASARRMSARRNFVRSTVSPEFRGYATSIWIASAGMSGLRSNIGTARGYSGALTNEVFMHKVIFYPVGNGDTSQIVLENGRRLLFDYRHLACGEEEERPEIDLAKRLREELAEAKKKSFDVVAFSHGDDDHICGSTDFFELDHSSAYQGGDRIKIDELWVPAAVILETGTHSDREKEVILWRQEARYRLREGKGIRVFSKPDKLKAWLEENDIKLADVRHLITDAGKLADGFTLANDDVEFFCHSPFIKHCDDGTDIIRNDSSLIFNVRFKAGEQTFDYLAVGDATSDVLADIYNTTRWHKNLDRLAWDIFNIPHHCSFRALDQDAKGETETVPIAGVKEILLAGREGSYQVSSSRPIDDDKDAQERVLPPHIQAKRCYANHLNQVRGAKLLVTMEEPNRRKPEPIVFEISSNGIKRGTVTATGAASLISVAAPRAG